MSNHYIFRFNADLRLSLSDQERAVIDFKLGSKPNDNTAQGKKAFADCGFSDAPFGFQYREYPAESYRCKLWIVKDDNGGNERLSIDLKLPGKKLEEIYEECLPFASWLACRSLSSGLVGSIGEEAPGDSKPTQLFIFADELYLGTTEEAHSFSSGKIICPSRPAT